MAVTNCNAHCTLSSCKSTATAVDRPFTHLFSSLNSYACSSLPRPDTVLYVQLSVLIIGLLTFASPKPNILSALSWVRNFEHSPCQQAGCDMHRSTLKAAKASLPHIHTSATTKPDDTHTHKCTTNRAKVHNLLRQYPFPGLNLPPHRCACILRPYQHPQLHPYPHHGSPFCLRHTRIPVHTHLLMTKKAWQQQQSGGLQLTLLPTQALVSSSGKPEK